MAGNDRNPRVEFKDTDYQRLIGLKLDEVNGKDPQKVKSLNALIDKLENFVKGQANGITPSQLRNIYSVIKELEDDKLGELIFLRPKLAYISARQQNRKALVMTDFISKLISKVSTQAEFKNFKTVMEAVVAYHKLYYKGN